MLKTAVEIASQTRDSRRETFCRTELGNVYRRVGRLKASRDEYKRVWFERRSWNDQWSAQALCNLAEAEVGLGNLDQGRNFVSEAIRLLEGIQRTQDRFDDGLFNMEIAWANLTLAGVEAKALRTVESQQSYKKAFDIATNCSEIGEAHPLYAIFLSGGAEVHLRSSLPLDAKRVGERSLALWSDSYGDEHSLTATTRFTLARAEWKLGNSKAARKHVDMAIAIEASAAPDSIRIPEMRLFQDTLKPKRRGRS